EGSTSYTTPRDLTVRPADKSLRDMEGAPSLVSVRVSKYPKPEVRRFYEATGWSDNFAPGPEVSDWI
ncbi:hypothetical protein, partial [Nocardioides caeni]|uniref:hypothetical protein n=1 Tax=Nocardioides caeni TaxID=574700 RepID=UPI001EE99374